MGQALSCLDPNKDPAANTAKKHPGRAEAIAEYKARKKSKKSDPPAPPVNNVQEPVEATPLDEQQTAASRDVPEGAIEDVTEELDPKAVTADDTKEPADETVIPVEQPAEAEAKELEPAVDADGDDIAKDTEAIDKVKATDELANDIEGDTNAVEELSEDAKDVEDDTKAVEEDVEDDTKAVKEDVEGAVEAPSLDAAKDVPALEAVSEAQTDAVSPLISMQRAVFEQGDDTIPEAKSLLRDVQDPVTGDMVTLAEYRARQAERAQGVVKEHVDKYEELDEVAAKETETLKLQEEARAKGREVRSWSTPTNRSQPSSPVEPRRMDLEKLI